MEPRNPYDVLSPASTGWAVDARQYWQLVLKWKWIVLSCVVGTAGLAGAYIVRQPKIYQSAASIIIDVTAPRFLDVQDVAESNSANFWYNREYYNTQRDIILSRTVAQRVVEKLGLAQDAAFLGLAGIRDDAKRAERMARADAAGVLQRLVEVRPGKESRRVEIILTDTDPNRAALLANALAESYRAEILAQKAQIFEDASRFLGERKDNLENKSRESEIAVYNFKKEADMLTTSLEDRQSMVSARLISVNQALSETQLKIAGLKARFEAVDASRKAAEGRPDKLAQGLPGAADNPLIQQLKLRYTNQHTECAEMKERYLDAHPRLRACQEKLEAARIDLQAELDNLVGVAQTELREAQQRERNLASLFEKAKEEAFQVNKRQIEYDQIRKNAETDARLYDSVLKRLKDVELAGLIRTSNIRMLDAARPSLIPVRPRVALVVAIAALVGMFLGLIVVVALDALDSTLAVPPQVEERLHIPCLGIVPSMEELTPQQVADRSLVVERHPQTSIAECYRALRTNLLFMGHEKGVHSLLITSSGPSEGKSTTVTNLASAMAKSGKRVVVVDTDMRRPTMHKAFGVPNTVGISSVLVGEARLDDALKSTEVPGLFVLPCGPVPPNPAELLHTEAFAQLRRQLAERFDSVLFDSPPVGAVADGLVLAAQVDGVLFVLRSGKTQREAARRAIRSLKGVHATVTGGILNDVRLNDPKYGAYYGAYPGYYRYYGPSTEGTPGR